MFQNRDPLYNKYTQLRGNIIVLEGLIGVGKTTLGSSLEKRLHDMGITAKFFPEYVNKSLLDQYIHNMEKYSYTFQLFMLSKRIQTYRDAETFAQKGGIAIIDRSVYGDMAFAYMQKIKGFINEDEWQTYLKIMHQEIQLEPHSIIYLQCNTDNCLKRLVQRGDKVEIDGYQAEYFIDLQKAYDYVFKAYNNTHIIYLDWNNFSAFDGIHLRRDVIDEFLQRVIAEK